MRKDLTPNTEAGNTNFVYFDMESIPSDSPDLLERYKSNLKPPANMKNPDTIEKWWNDKSDNVAREKLDKTSFDGGRGRVCVISWAVNDDTSNTRRIGGFGDSSHWLDEADIMRSFFYSLPKSDVCLVGHNISGFDIPFLTKRAICLGVTLPNTWQWPRDPKKWGGRGYFDTMNQWDANNMVGQDELCDILGIEGKSGMDGSQVAAEWAKGNYQKVADYCADDVATVRKIHQFFLKAGY